MSATPRGRHGVAVTHTPNTNTIAVAEFILAQPLAVLRGLVPHDRASHAGRRRGPPAGRSRELPEATPGLRRQPAADGDRFRAPAERARAAPRA